MFSEALNKNRGIFAIKTPPCSVNQKPLIYSQERMTLISLTRKSEFEVLEKKKLIVINGIKFEHGLVYKFSIYSNRTERVAEQ